jgi:Mg2+ and Co2+ transporter CorA
MAHIWRIVKNSQLNGHRPVGEFHQELNQEIDALSAGEAEGFEIHENAREALGLGVGEQVANFDQLFSNPYPRLENHGNYLFGCFSVPTNLADGVSEYTSLFVIATSTQMLSVIMDPHTSYAGPFGQRLLNRRNEHLKVGGDDVGKTLLLIIRDSLTSVNFGLSEIFEDVMYYSTQMDKLADRKDHKKSDVLGNIESYVLKLRVEVESLETITRETASLVQAVANGSLYFKNGNQIFLETHEIIAQGLAMNARQTIALRNKIESRIGGVLDKCEQIRDRIMLNATHKFGAYAAILLVPTLIVGVYGQNFDMPERHWFFGYGFSWGLIVLSTVTQIIFFRRKKWL